MRKEIVVREIEETLGSSVGIIIIPGSVIGKLTASYKLNSWSVVRKPVVTAD